MKKKLISVLCALSMTMSVASLPFMPATTAQAAGARQMENLGRGVVAVRSATNTVFVSWRSLALDDADMAFNVYRKTNGTTTKLNSSPITGGTNFTDTTADMSKDNEYFVRPILDGYLGTQSGSFTLKANSTVGPCYTIPLKNGGDIRDVWVGDLDGDGEYDYVLSRMGTEQSIEAYTRAGKHLWTVNYGPNSQNQDNISPGAATICVGMWDGVTVYDLNGDGKAEVITKAANGTVFGDGNSWGNGGANDQWLVVLDGMTGALSRYCKLPTDYKSAGPLALQLGIGYLDGQTPSIIASMKNRNSDKSFNMVVCAYKYTNSKLSLQWQWNRGSQDLADGHQFRVADIDKDGQDEVCHIGFALESDGTLKYSLTKKGVVHGDRFYVGQFDKTGPIRGYGVQQDNPNGMLEYYYNASNGNMTWEHYASGTDNDVARGCIGDLDPNYAGYEVWSFSGIYNGPKNTQITGGDNQPYPALDIWWDGDVFRESVNSGKIEKWNYQSSGVNRLTTTWNYHGATRNNRDLPLFHGDIIGDWREEVIFQNPDHNTLIVFTTPIESDVRLYTLAQNPLYRNCMTIKGYVESHTVDYYLGHSMDTPAQPNIYTPGGSRESFNEPVVEEKPAATAATITEGVYCLKNVNSGLYLDVANGSGENGANVQQHPGNGATAQQFKIVSAGNGYYKLLTGCSNYTQAVDVSGKKTADGTNILTWASGSGTNQHFKFVKESDGSYAILTRVTGDASAMEVAGQSKSKNANVQQYSYWGGASQRWYLEKAVVATPTPAPTPTPTPKPTATPAPTQAPTVTYATIEEGVYNLRNVNSGKYLDVANGQATNGANVQQYEYNGATAQQFKIVSAGNGYYKLLTACSDYTQAVDVSEASAANSANILTWASGSGKNQQFKFLPANNGSYAIMTRISSLASALDVAGMSKDNGANVCQYEYWGGTGQMWYLEKVNTSGSSGSSATTGTNKSWNFANSSFTALGTLSSNKTVDGLTILATSAKTVNLASGYLALGGSGSTSYRAMKFDVTGPCTIKVNAKSSGSSARTLVVSNGSSQLGTIAAPTTAADGTYKYTGGAGTIYIYSSNSGINVYSASVTY